MSVAAACLQAKMQSLQLCQRSSGAGLLQTCPGLAITAATYASIIHCDEHTKMTMSKGIINDATLTCA